MVHPLVRRLIRAVLYALPLALAAAFFAGWPSAAFSAIPVAAFVLFWRGPGEVRAMARTVAGLQHDLAVQRLELKATVDFLTAEREIGLVLGEDVELRAILEKVLAIVAGLLGNRSDDEIELFFRERDEERPTLKCAWAEGKARFGRGLAKLGREDDLVQSALTQGIQSRLHGGRLEVCVPLEYDGRVIGAVRTDVAAGPDWDERVRLLLPRFAELARFIALALKTPDLYTRAVEDGLTGLATKRHFLTQLDEMVERARRGGEPLSIVMIDIDHFKKINDGFGHLTGDIVLKGVADVIRKGVRLKAGDRACNAYRYGGEEMCLLLPRATAEKAAEVAERLRQAIQARIFSGEKREPVSVTASFGVAQLDAEPAASPEDFVSRADEALYRAKESGRNRVVVWEPGSGKGRLPLCAPSTLFHR